MAKAKGKLVCVVGENLADLFVANDGSVVANPGGGPFNVARTIARLGQSSMLFSGLSADAFGRVLHDSLVNDHVELAIPEALSLPTSLAVIDLVDGIPQYFFHLDGTAAYALEESTTRELFSSLSPRVGALYFGTLGLLVEPMASTGEALLNDAGDEVIVVLDPNCRPSAVRDEAAFRDRLGRLYQRSDVVKVSTEDLDYLYPGEDYVVAAREILTAGAKCVVVTDGPAHVHVVHQDGVTSIAVPKTEVVDTVGAGDALVGGLLAWWIGQGFTREDLTNRDLFQSAIRAAITIASSTCTRRGAEPPYVRDVENDPAWSWARE